VRERLCLRREYESGEASYLSYRERFVLSPRGIKPLCNLHGIRNRLARGRSLLPRSLIIGLEKENAALRTKLAEVLGRPDHTGDE
jgi:hypothetical protein